MQTNGIIKEVAMATTVPLTAHAGEKQDTEHTGSKREGRLLALSATVSVALALALIVLTYAVRLEASRSSDVTWTPTRRRGPPQRARDARVVRPAADP